MSTTTVDLVLLLAVSLICAAAPFFRSSGAGYVSPPASEMVLVAIVCADDDLAELVDPSYLRVEFRRKEGTAGLRPQVLDARLLEQSRGLLRFVVPKADLGVVEIALVGLPAHSPLVNSFEGLTLLIDAGSRGRGVAALSVSAGLLRAVEL